MRLASGRRRAWVAGVPVIAMLLTAVVSCGSSGSDGAASSASAPAGSSASSAAPASSAGGSGATKIGGSLTIYTPNEQNMLDQLIPKFESETGIKVNLVTAATGELYTRIQNEASNPQGDVLFGGGVAQAMDNADLWQDYTGKNDSAMEPVGKNVGGYSTPYQADTSVLLVNTDKIGDIKAEGYADLLNPALKGKLAFGDPTNSSSAFAQLTNMLADMGGSDDVDTDYTSDAGWNYVKELLQQTGGKSIGSSSEVAQDVAQGEYAVALTYEAQALNMVASGAPVKIVYMSEGVVALPSGVEIIKGAKDVPQAQAFCDWIQSEEAQQIIADKTTGRPLRAGVKKSGVPLLSSVKTRTEDSAYVSEHRNDLLKKFTDILATVS